jgi:hypothetical protein
LLAGWPTTGVLADEFSLRILGQRPDHDTVTEVNNDHAVGVPPGSSFRGDRHLTVAGHLHHVTGHDVII